VFIQKKTIPAPSFSPFSGTDPDVGSSFFKKTAWNAIASLLNMVSRLSASIVIARSLGTEGTGWIAYLMWVSETAAIFLSAGFPEGLSRYLAEFSRQKSTGQGLARWIFGRFLGQSLLGIVIIGLCGHLWMAAQYDDKVLLIFLVMLLTRLLSGIYQSYLTGLQRFDLLARINLISSVGLIAGVFVGVRLFGTAGALAGYALGTLIPALLSFSMLLGSSQQIHPDFPLKKRFRDYTLFLWFSNILGAFVWARMEVFFLHRYWSDSEVSMFSVPQTVAGLILNLAAMLSGAFMPYFAELSGSKNHEKIRTVFGSGNRLLALFLFPTALGGAAIMPVLFPLFYGHKFDPGIPNTMVLFAASFITFGNISSALLTGLDRSRFVATTTLIAACLSAIAGFTVIRFWGSWGAVWSRSVIQIGLTAASYVYISRVIGCPVPLKSLIRLMASAVLCALAAGSVVHFIPDLKGLILGLFSGFVTYVVSVKVIGGLEPVDAGHLERILRRLPQGLGPISIQLLHLVAPRS